ncbi:DNA polymerase III, subunit gamma and tau [Candidatus Woesebacteria bacterium RIFOXYA1_FULL_40_18]|uniref:DNA polymerase III subunit gamma/tau n=3 Tax=Candidatus Woeseibacteriota TaxID=1752722 RepID=A0A1F8CLA3_9BACT|nr:MAG: DNA polymerase III, subunit gamma and tau [Candidatus Woesebacteria bacterium RIFOXYA1_FULL_40_18]OGM81215.1 MAG: DNA polymerase III, subunit gamma and tau [Candidatus Woesebacteria bacterium RIFOXYB1_FULL_40_26]OGM87689.1 MAG: DNA polymerase III, subunit gamma and tau [Candidatus Woesebacteria bacterium RIFOXYD1_FULL_40_21]
MTLYLKYRGQTLEEIDLQEVRESLKRLASSGKIPHALLFSGPKGSGKTSAARILAKIINCEKNQPRRNASLGGPCNKCEQCVSITKGSNIDIIELDAASHRGIDDVRALKDAVKLSAARARKKVYIIDEAHMLTLEASNALLKTLEEPPDHVIFILATTNPEKLIETIRSRCLNIVFKKATPDEITRSLDRAVKGEKIKIKEDAVKVIAEKSDGSFRDAVKTLEQLTSEKESLDKKSVEEFLFKRKTFNLEEFLAYLAGKETKKALEEVEQVIQKGGSMENLLELLLVRLRAGLLAKLGIASGPEGLWPGGEKFSKEDLMNLIEIFTQASSQLKGAFIEQLPVEVAVVKWCEGIAEQSQSARLDQNSSPPPTSAKLGRGTGSAHIRSDSISPNLTQTIDPGARRQAPAPVIKIEGKEITEETWRVILAHVKPINTSIEALLRAAKPVGYDGKILTLGVFYKFHKERLEENNYRRVLEDVATQVLGSSVRIVCTLTEPPPRREPEVKNPPAGPEAVLTEGEDKDIIKIAEEIFGN